MRRLPLLALSFFIAQFAGAAEIASYDLTLRVSADGTARGQLLVRLEGVTAGSVPIPLGFGEVKDAALVLGPHGTALSVAPLNGHSVVTVTLPEGTPSPAEIGLDFGAANLFAAPGKPGSKGALPRGSRMLGVTLMNSQPATIGAYEARVVFPDGMRAHAVREALPKLAASEPGPRVQLCAVDGKPGARIHVARLLQGETAAMKIELVESGRSPGWLIAGVLLSVLYLVYFRDLVSPRAE